MLSDSKMYYQSANNFTEKVLSKRNSNKGSAVRTFTLEKRKIIAKARSFKNYQADFNTSPSASIIYQNNFYKSSYNSNGREQNLGFTENNSYCHPNQSANSSMQRRRLKRRDSREIKMKITKINISSRPKIKKSCS